MDLLAQREEILAKILEENDKKLMISLVQIGEREKSLKKLLKSEFEQVKLNFFKNLIHNFQLIENQFRLIETDRSSPKFFKTILIDRKTASIDQNSGKKTPF